MTTLLGRGAVFEGTLQVDSGVCIEGTFRGRLESRGRVILARGGCLEAEVVAASVAVHGTLEGSVMARDQLHVGESGCIRGEVVAGSIAVAQGGRLEGVCRMAQAAEPDTREECALAAGTGVRDVSQVEPEVEAAAG